VNEKRKVFVVAKGYHDFSAAEQHGELVFLSTEIVNRTAVSNMLREFFPRMEGSNPEDYIVITGLSVMCSIACVIFALKHKRLNLLLFDAAGDKYVKRSVILDSIEQVERELDEAARLTT
jgi:hypothetical protein